MQELGNPKRNVPRQTYLTHIVLLFLFTFSVGFGQTAFAVRSTTVLLPAHTVDGNSPGVWVDGTLKVFTSTGILLSMAGPDLHSLENAEPPAILWNEPISMWIESVWRDDDGTVYAWYHHEPGNLCGGKLTAPKIGALVSYDGGATFEDLGIVLASGEPLNCSAQNGFFAGGHGDFSVVLDQDRTFFYFLFGNYGGAAGSQGVAIARMAFEDRAQPVGAVSKLWQGEWSQPGVGGAVTPILPVRKAWERSDTDAFWGPAIHWNTSIQSYVVLLNHACCKPEWPQEGIYIMFGSNLADPKTWTSPRKLLDDSEIGFAPGFYPQVFGQGPGETDSIAGAMPRLFVKGISKWLLALYPADPLDPGEPRKRQPEPVPVFD